jgi:hypothetical protein
MPLIHCSCSINAEEDVIKETNEMMQEEREGYRKGGISRDMDNALEIEKEEPNQ